MPQESGHRQRVASRTTHMFDGEQGGEVRARGKVGDPLAKSARAVLEHKRERQRVLDLILTGVVCVRALRQGGGSKKHELIGVREGENGSSDGGSLLWREHGVKVDGAGQADDGSVAHRDVMRDGSMASRIPGLCIKAGYPPQHNTARGQHSKDHVMQRMIVRLQWYLSNWLKEKRFKDNAYTRMHNK